MRLNYSLLEKLSACHRDCRDWNTKTYPYKSSLELGEKSLVSEHEGQPMKSISIPENRFFKGSTMCSNISPLNLHSQLDNLEWGCNITCYGTC